MIQIDIHTHTQASHGRGSVAEMLQAAKERGLEIYGFSEHSPRPEGYDYSHDYRQHLLAAFPQYVQDILEAQARHEVPKVLLGMELDWLPAEKDFMIQAVEAWDFDYIIGGIHFLDHWGFDASGEDWIKLTLQEREEAYSRYYQEMKNMAEFRYNGKRLVDVVAHPDLIKIFTVEDFHRWIPKNLDLVRSALSAIKEAGMALEISSAGLRKPCAEIYPHPAILRLASKLGLSISFGSDAHDPTLPGYAFEQLAQYARSFGYSESSYFTKHQVYSCNFS